MVMATQNPIEQEGTYPLPEAELDRFMLMLRMDYPQADEELELVRQVSRSARADMLDVSALRQLVQRDVQALQKIASELPLDEQVLDYAVRLVRSTLARPGAGCWPRASIALVRGGRARALLRRVRHPDDIKLRAGRASPSRTAFGGTGYRGAFGGSGSTGYSIRSRRRAHESIRRLLVALAALALLALVIGVLAALQLSSQPAAAGLVGLLLALLATALFDVSVAAPADRVQQPVGQPAAGHWSRCSLR